MLFKWYLYEAKDLMLRFRTWFILKFILRMSVFELLRSGNGSYRFKYNLNFPRPRSRWSRKELPNIMVLIDRELINEYDRGVAEDYFWYFPDDIIFYIEKFGIEKKDLQKYFLADIITTVVRYY